MEKEMHCNTVTWGHPRPPVGYMEVRIYCKGKYGQDMLNPGPQEVETRYFIECMARQAMVAMRLIRYTDIEL